MDAEKEFLQQQLTCINSNQSIMPPQKLPMLMMKASA